MREKTVERIKAVDKLASDSSLTKYQALKQIGLSPATYYTYRTKTKKAVAKPRSRRRPRYEAIQVSAPPQDNSQISISATPKALAVFLGSLAARSL